VLPRIDLWRSVAQRGGTCKYIATGRGGEA
jgi:hypothetical protein